MSKPQTIKFKTTAKIENGWTIVVYYDTAIVKFNEDKIILNTGGWFTRTTCQRMNFVSEKYNLGYQVLTEGDNWVVSYQGSYLEFQENELTITC